VKFVKYPDVTVIVTDLKGNPFEISKRMARALRDAGVPEAEIEALVLKATSGNHDHFLRTVWKNFEVL
jgi:hypothetical protein